MCQNGVKSIFRTPPTSITYSWINLKPRIGLGCYAPFHWSNPHDTTVCKIPLTGQLAEPYTKNYWPAKWTRAIWTRVPCFFFGSFLPAPPIALSVFSLFLTLSVCPHINKYNRFVANGDVLPFTFSREGSPYNHGTKPLKRGVTANGNPPKPINNQHEL